MNNIISVEEAIKTLKESLTDMHRPAPQENGVEPDELVEEEQPVEKEQEILDMDDLENVHETKHHINIPHVHLRNNQHLTINAPHKNLKMGKVNLSGSNSVMDIFLLI